MNTRRVIDRLDLTAGKLAAVLLVGMLGLAAFAFAGFFALPGPDMLPARPHARPVSAAASKQPPQTRLSLAALAPTKPDAPLTGW
jgi:hypothetical protein